MRLFAVITGNSEDQAAKAPNFHVVAVNKPERLVGRFMIIGAFDDFGRPRNAVLRVDKIDSICGHSALPCLRRERYRTLSHRRQKATAGDTGMWGRCELNPSVKRRTREKKRPQINSGMVLSGTLLLSNGVVPMCARATKTKRLA
jgi:hypothetical protein